MKERVTLTIERDILQKVDQMVDRSRIKNRSHAVELLLIKSIGGNRPSKALILAGGKGTRMGDLAKTIPKCLLKIQGKPIMEHIILLFKKYEIKDIIICVGHLSEQIIDYFGDGKKFGVSITYIKENNPMGTAGPLKLAKKFLTETFIMCNGDELKEIDLEDMYNFHRENRGMSTIALTTVEDPSAYGVAVINGNKIVAFVEKPSKANAPSNLISAGLYILEPEVINTIPDGYSMIENDVFPKLAGEDGLFGYPFSGQWFDTGTPERFKKAERHWKGLSPL